ncbi:MAG: hypothetical protein AAB480_04640 [Patescibacteria group bacterium]|mgnify:FL=1
MHRNEQENWLYKYRPHYPRFEQIPHYYGDAVRMLFLVAAVVMLGGAPFYADMLKQQLPFLIAGAAVMVMLAATTSPWSVMVMRLNAVVSGVGAVVFEYWALMNYQTGTPVEFALRQAIALMCMFAFYFALKTLRSMLMGTVGKEADLTEFEDNETKREIEDLEQFSEPVPEDGLGHVPALEDDHGSD